MRWLPGRALLFLFVASIAMPASAAVTLTFLSRDLGVNFPHAFVETTGATDADPATPIHANYGFTAKAISPSILLGPVTGEVMAVDENYIQGSERHFSLTLSDAQYAAFLKLVDEWRALPGRSYDLHKRNCVHFVEAIAKFIGLTVDHADALLLKPRSFLDEVAFENKGTVHMIDSYKPKLDEQAWKASQTSASSKAPPGNGGGGQQ
jgi:hypothetical protein